MKRFFIVLMAAALMAPIATHAQEQERRLLTMEEAVLGTGVATQSRSFTWRDDSSAYTFVEGNTLKATSPKNGKTTDLITTERLAEITGLQLRSFPRVAWSDGNIVFNAGGNYLEVDIKEGKVVSKWATCYEANATALGGGRYAYTRDNNLYWVDAEGNEKAITNDTDPNFVSGQSVSRNEFGISGGIFPSPDGKKIAFYRKDESRVTDFPLLDITTRTGTLREIKYPMNGMPSEHVQLGIYDLATGSIVWAEVTDFTEERYLTNITWSPESDLIYIQVLDRLQKNMNLNAYSAKTGEIVRRLFSEHNEKFVEPQYPLIFLDNDPTRFIYATDNRDGYWNLYLGSTEGGEPKRLTAVDADVEYLCQTKTHIYYTSREVSPVDNHLCRVELRTGKMERLTVAEGVHSCSVSPDGKYFIDTYSSLNVPRVIELASTDGKKRTELFRAPHPAPNHNYLPVEMGTIKSADSEYDNHYALIRPIDFDPSKKYPVIVYVYGGPHTQLISNTFLGGTSRWEMYMAQRGYVVFVMDNRGTPYHGAAYEKETHRQLGQAEMADQVKGIEWLTSHPWVDAERIGVHGWSYGGFMTISLMTNYPDIYKVGVAGGPVIDWKWYEVMYGERYMENPEINPEGFEKTSLINKAADLKGDLLICQGAVDDVVVWQHCLNFIYECINNGVQLDFFTYPTHPHNVSGIDRVHLMHKVTNYFDLHLGNEPR